jgi:hypothetical protein
MLMCPTATPILRRRRPGPVLAALTCVVGVLTGCESGVDAPEVRAAYEGLLAALEARDAAGIWGASDPVTRTELSAFLTRAREAQALVPSLWGDARGADAMRGYEALAKDLTDGAGAGEEAGPKLVAAVLHVGDLRWTEGSREAAAHPTITLEAGPPERAIVRIPSGESFTFERHEGAWYSMLLREATLGTPRFKGYLENIDKTLALHRDAEAARLRSEDARTPEGAWNVIRRAIGKGKDGADVLWAALDEPSREAVRAALDAGRKAQRRIQGRTAKALRPAAYAEAGIGAIASAESDVALFTAWVASNPFPSGRADDPPAAFETSPDGPDRGALVTKSGARIGMSRRDDGLWCLTDLGPKLEESLLVPAAAAAEPPQP